VDVVCATTYLGVTPDVLDATTTLALATYLSVGVDQLQEPALHQLFTEGFFSTSGTSPYLRRHGASGDEVLNPVPFHLKPE